MTQYEFNSSFESAEKAIDDDNWAIFLERRKKGIHPGEFYMTEPVRIAKGEDIEDIHQIVHEYEELEEMIEDYGAETVTRLLTKAGYR